MILNCVNGKRMDSRSITGTGGVVEDDVLAPDPVWGAFRLGGTLSIAVGCAMCIDSTLEVQQGTTTYAAANLLTGASVVDPFGRQVVPTTGLTAVGASYHFFCGVYSGKGGSYKGYNMAGVTCTATSISLNNVFTYQNSTAVVVPGDAARPGDVIMVAIYGHAVAWVSDVNATAAGQPISNCGTNAPADGTMSLTLAANLVGVGRCVTFDNPTTYSSTGAAMGCRVWVQAM